MDEGDNLGPATPWAVRSLPESIRKAIVDRARDEGISVADLITKMVLGTDVQPAPPQAPGSVDPDILLKWLQCAEMLAKVDLPAQVRASARILIGQEIRAIRREQRRTARLALPSPK